jgi:hypothetical protein
VSVAGFGTPRSEGIEAGSAQGCFNLGLPREGAGGDCSLVNVSLLDVIENKLMHLWETMIL